jgi:hypothetical protein
MATIVNFFGRNVIEPGSYAATTRKQISTVNVSEFGNVMIIDTGNLVGADGLEFSGGSGINGTSYQGSKSIYEFRGFEDFFNFIGGGGLLSLVAQKLFIPADGLLGTPKLFYARAAATKPAVMNVPAGADGALVLTCKNEGTVGNANDGNKAIPTSKANLKTGYACAIVSGTTGTNNTYILEVYRGTWSGLDSGGEPYGNYSFDNSVAQTISRSPEFTTLQDLFDWANSDLVMNNNFFITMTGNGSANLVSVEFTTASGGETDYNSPFAYQNVLESIAEMDISFFLAPTMNFAQSSDSATIGLLKTAMLNEFKFSTVCVVPGGNGKADATDLFNTNTLTTNTSEALARLFDSENFVVAHAAPVVPRRDRNGTKVLPAVVFAASVVGMNAGGQAQQPLTFRRVGYQSFVYDLKKKERERALQTGILHVRNVSGFWCINQGITTLLDNKRTLTDDGKSFELSVVLIKAQLNKELILEGQVRFTGKTIAQADPASVKNFTETKLASLVAIPGSDNLILNWKNVKVTAQNSDYTVTYDFVPNLPVNKTFFVGNILDFTF